MSLSFATSLTRNSMQLFLRTGLCSSHSILWGLFQFLGRGPGRTLYRFARRSISVTNSVFFGQNKLFGSRDHGSFSRESRGVSPSMAFKPIQSRNKKVFYHFRIPRRLVDTDKTPPLSTTSLLFLGAVLVLISSTSHWFFIRGGATSVLSLLQRDNTSGIHADV